MKNILLVYIYLKHFQLFYIINSKATTFEMLKNTGKPSFVSFIKDAVKLDLTKIYESRRKYCRRVSLVSWTRDMRGRCSMDFTAKPTKNLRLFYRCGVLVSGALDKKESTTIPSINYLRPIRIEFHKI